MGRRGTDMRLRSFTKEFPARVFYGVGGPLLFSARFEVQGVAVKR